jgi:predicted ATP-dependent protease
VVLPAANARNLVLRDEVSGAVASGRFHVWTVETIEDAIALFTGLEAGTPDPDGAYPPDTLLARVQATLEDFDRRLAARPG